MDPHSSRRYLLAMGVQLWRLRQSHPEELEAGCAGEDGVQASSPSASPVEAVPAAVDAVSGFGADIASQPRGGPAMAAGAGDAVADMDWDRLQEAVAACRACSLCETRTQTVFGVGNRRADLMIIGEAPGADEDRQGEPFVGRAGQLLNLMLGAIGLKRDQVYIANILKCRPPGNRDPRPEEALRCERFLMRQIALIRPRVLLSVGRISAQNLLKTDAPIGKLRGRWFELGPERAPLSVTYHPAYLLRSPEQKGRVWRDLLEVARRLREPVGGVGTRSER
ncbi:MAG: uracil-DNA glycosylase [Pseudomonadota bacterium]|nr:uracil-DNA glycosylase [Pseudomonadota bacterium]